MENKLFIGNNVIVPTEVDFKGIQRVGGKFYVKNSCIVLYKEWKKYEERHFIDRTVILPENAQFLRTICRSSLFMKSKNKISASLSETSYIFKTPIKNYITLEQDEMYISITCVEGMKAQSLQISYDDNFPSTKDVYIW